MRGNGRHSRMRSVDQEYNSKMIKTQILKAITVNGVGVSAIERADEYILIKTSNISLGNNVACNDVTIIPHQAVAKRDASSF